jgi:hypothetical protein
LKFLTEFAAVVEGPQIGGTSAADLVAPFDQRR